MRNFIFLLVGILFGIIMTKSEAISWYRIQEMFRFQSFHMYGIIGTAVGTGLVLFQWIKRSGFKTIDHNMPEIKPKANNFIAALAGGTIFGLGWALTGACPGPLYVLVGNGFLVFIPVILSAVVGTFVYGLLRDKMPH